MKKNFLYLSTAIIFATSVNSSDLDINLRDLGINKQCNMNNFTSDISITPEEIGEIQNSRPVGATLQDTNASTAISRIYGTTGSLIFDDEITKTLIKMGCGATVTGQGQGSFDLVYYNQDASSTFSGTSFSNGSTTLSANITVTLGGQQYVYTAPGAAIPAGSMLTFRASTNGAVSDPSKIFSLRTASAIPLPTSPATATGQATAITAMLNASFPNSSTIRGNSKNISAAYDAIISASGAIPQTTVSGVFTNGMFQNPILTTPTLPTTFNGSSFTSSSANVSVIIGGETFTHNVPNGSSSSALSTGSLIVFGNGSTLANSTKTFSIMNSSQIAPNSSDSARANEISTGLNDYFKNGSSISSTYQLPNNNQVLSMLGATEVQGTSGGGFNNIFLNKIGSTQTFDGYSFSASNGSVTVTINGSSYVYTETLTGQTTSGSKIVFAGPNGASLTLQSTATIGSSSDTSNQKAEAIASELNTFFPNNSEIFANEVTVLDAILSTASLIKQNPTIGNENSLYDLTKAQLNKLTSPSDSTTYVSTNLGGVIYSDPVLSHPTNTETTFSYSSFNLIGTTISVTIDGTVYTYTPTSGSLSSGSVIFTGSSGKTMTVDLANSYSQPTISMLALQMTIDLNNAFNGVTIYKNPLTIDNAINSINAMIGGGQTTVTGTSGSDFSNVDCNFDLGSSGVTFTNSSFADSSADITVTIRNSSLTYTTTANGEVPSGTVITFEGEDGEVLEVTTGAAIGTTGNTATQNAALIATALNTYFAPATLMSSAEFVDQTVGNKFTSAAITAINEATTTYDKMQAFLGLFNAMQHGETVTFTKPTGTITTFAELIASFE